MIPPQIIMAAAGEAKKKIDGIKSGLVNTQRELSNHFNGLATSNLATGYDSSNNGTVGGGMFDILSAFKNGMDGVKHQAPKFEGAPLKNVFDTTKPTVEPPKPDTGTQVNDLQNNPSSIMNTLDTFKDSKLDFSSITAAAQSFKKGGMVKC